LPAYDQKQVPQETTMNIVHKHDSLKSQKWTRLQGMSSRNECNVQISALIFKPKEKPATEERYRGSKRLQPPSSA